MTLAFSTHINDTPTFFAEKIWHGLYDNGYTDRDYSKHQLIHENAVGSGFDQPESFSDLPHKIHTIRWDLKNRWKPGNKIHMVYGNRTKERRQIAPTIVCKSTQLISIRWIVIHDYPNAKEEPVVWIDSKCFAYGWGASNHETLARNDGFNTVEEFYQYFSEDFDGKIIHWTSLTYQDRNKSND